MAGRNTIHAISTQARIAAIVHTHRQTRIAQGVGQRRLDPPIVYPRR